MNTPFGDHPGIKQADDEGQRVLNVEHNVQSKDVDVDVLAELANLRTMIESTNRTVAELQARIDERETPY